MQTILKSWIELGKGQTAIASVASFVAITLVNKVIILYQNITKVLEMDLIFHDWMLTCFVHYFPLTLVDVVQDAGLICSIDKMFSQSDKLDDIASNTKQSWRKDSLVFSSLDVDHFFSDFVLAVLKKLRALWRHWYARLRFINIAIR